MIAGVFLSFHAEVSAIRAEAESMGTMMGPLGRYSVLVVDDEPLIATGLNEVLCDAGADLIHGRCLGGGGEEHVSAAIIDIQLGSPDCRAACTAPSLPEVSFLFFSEFRQS